MKSVKWIFTEMTGLIASLCMLTYVTFIFLIGIYPDVIPSVFLGNADARNMFICVIHSIGYIMFMIYLSLYIRPKFFDNVPIAMAATNMIVYTLCMVLVWRCYFVNELEPLIFVITVYGTMLAAFKLTISYTMYSVIDEYKKKTISGNFVFQLINYGSILFFIAAILTYYRHVSNFMYSQFGFVMKSRDVDALALFCCIIGFVLQTLSFIQGYFLDKTSEKMFLYLQKNK